MNNLIKSPKDLKKFRNKKFKFIVSSREIQPEISIIDYLKIHYIYINPEQIDHVFGSTTQGSPLYGGRVYDSRHSLTDKHIEELRNNNIGLSLNLSNHFFDKKAYDESLDLLNKHHHTNNSLIITNDSLAKQVRKDFPLYQLKASIIKNITTIQKIEKALEIYDYVTLPMDKNDDDNFLRQIEAKDKVILFANAACAYNCPACTCYLGFSRINRGEKATSECSRKKIQRPSLGSVFFDIEKLSSLGFCYFKLIPNLKFNSNRAIEFLQRNKFKKDINNSKPTAVIASYPKSGRTWVRFILANYFNNLFNLGLNIDLHNFFSVLPNDIPEGITGIKAYNYHNKSDIPYIQFSHKKRNKLPAHGKFILILRSPFDTLVSDYFQNTKHLRTYEGDIKSFIRNSRLGIQRLCNYLNDWSMDILNKKIHLISYESLSQDTFLIMKGMLEFLEVRVNETYLKEAINASEFKSMQSLEQKQGMPNQGYDLNENNALRMRESGSGRYKKHLDEQDIEYISDYLNENLDPELFDFLKQTSGFTMLENKTRSLILG